MRTALCGALLVLATVSCTSDQKRVATALAARHYHAGEWGLQYLPPGVTIYGTATIDPITGKQVIVGKATEDQMRHACDVEPTRQECLSYSRAVNRLDHEANLSNESQKLGKLPPTARKNLKTWTDCVERKGQCPALTTSAK